MLVCKYLKYVVGLFCLTFYLDVICIEQNLKYWIIVSHEICDQVSS